MNFRKIASALVLLLLPLAVFAQFAGQQVTAITPLTRDLGAVITFTGISPSTVNSAALSGYNVTRVICVYNQASHTNSTQSTTMAIQNYDAASASWYQAIISAAITADTTPTYITIGPGAATTTNVSVNIPVAATWRVQIVETGAGSTTTGTVGCSVQ